MALKLKKTESVTREHFQMELGVEYYFEFQTQVYKAPNVRTRNVAGEVNKEPPMLADVLLFVEDAEGVLSKEYTIIINTVLKNILDDTYPGDALIGERLCVVKLPKVQGRDYNRFNVARFDLDDGEEPAVDTTPVPNRMRGKA